jgi:hypothetical protein
VELTEVIMIKYRAASKKTSSAETDLDLFRNIDELEKKEMNRKIQV